MVTEVLKEQILGRFCDLYEGREQEIGCQPLVYGDLLFIAQGTNTSVEEVALVLFEELIAE